MNPDSQLFPDRNQSFWELACIQSAGMGLPVIMAGGPLVNSFGVGKAITSVVIGNLLLWLVGMTIISMSSLDRDNAIQNVKKYLGKMGGILAALFLILAFLSWYILQIDAAVIVVSRLVHLRGGYLHWGAGFGLLIALLSIGGIRFIKLFCVYLFPFLLGFAGFQTFQLFPSFEFHGKFGFSFIGIITILGITLPGIVNLPTFFRHSRSNADSFLGLSLMITFTILFQIFAIVVGYNDLASVKATGLIDTVLLVGFVLLSMVAVNLVNIYFASAGWEMILPHRRSAKEYAIVGLLGTMAYTFLQISAPMEFLENMADNFIGSLGVVLLMAFLVKMVVRHRPRPGEQWVNVGCWLFGGTVGTVMGVSDGDAARVLIASICASAVAFLVVVFVEEGIWSFRKIWKRK